MMSRLPHPTLLAWDLPPPPLPPHPVVILNPLLSLSPFQSLPLTPLSSLYLTTSLPVASEL